MAESIVHKVPGSIKDCQSHRLRNAAMHSQKVCQIHPSISQQYRTRRWRKFQKQGKIGNLQQRFVNHGWQSETSDGSFCLSIYLPQLVSQLVSYQLVSQLGSQLATQLVKLVTLAHKLINQVGCLFVKLLKLVFQSSQLKVS